jgi:hypothetical protein
MAALVGGLRDRMLLQSAMSDIVADLTTRGWFNVGRDHKPFTVVDEFPDEKTEVELNTIAFSMGDSNSMAAELGSAAEIIHVPIFVDMFAENDGLGRHVVGDIHEFVKKQGQFEVRDYRVDPTPPTEFIVQLVENSIERSKPTRAVNSWQKHWHVVAFVVTEERSNV